MARLMPQQSPPGNWSSAKSIDPESRILFDTTDFPALGTRFSWRRNHRSLVLSIPPQGTGAGRRLRSAAALIIAASGYQRSASPALHRKGDGIGTRRSLG